MLNSVNIMGRLTANPEVITIDRKKGTCVCNIRIAVDDRFNREKTHFFDVELWNGTAEFVEKYFSKGDMIAVSGRLAMDEYEDKEHNKRNRVKIISENVSFCGGTKK